MARTVLIDTNQINNRILELQDTASVIEASNFNAWYGDNHALQDVTISIRKNKITAFIGPSGCGKTTFLKSINKMNLLVRSFKAEGSLTLDGTELYSTNKHDMNIRKRIGMVFQQPNPFPKTIYSNMKLPIVENKAKLSKQQINDLIEQKLTDAFLYEEVKDRMHKSAMKLSGGQQQRLCIARTMTLEPEVILFDEPCSALDPISTAKIEEMLLTLKEKYTIVIVTHNLQQASRIADHVAFFYKGKIEEQGTAADIFINPKSNITQDYVTGVI